eukprot:365423-Chlamydomonas_euryale.AAC.7
MRRQTADPKRRCTVSGRVLHATHAAQWLAHQPFALCSPPRASYRGTRHTVMIRHTWPVGFRPAAGAAG